MALIGNQKGKRMWPSLGTANSIADWANIFFIGSLVIGVVSTILIVWMSGVKEAYWERDRKESAERIADLGTQAEQLRKDAAEANARTAEASLKLEQLRKASGPRDINFEEFAKQIAGKPKARVVIWYLPDSSDGYWFANRLFAALAMAKWEAELPVPIPDITDEQIEAAIPSPGKLISILRATPKAVNAGGQPSGVSVISDDVDTDVNGSGPYSALFNALARSTNFSMTGAGGSKFMPVPKGQLRVIIAAKSEPMFLDPNARPAGK